MKTRLEAANDYVHKKTQHERTQAPHFHFSPPVGWINDPNGFSYYKGNYHLFYQYNPYNIIWNNILWGHATTVDFINWEHHPIALANDKLYDANGCFSGSAIEKDGKLYLMYTGNQDPNLLHQKDESQIKQVQCVAISEDGINFEKVAQNPVIGEQHLPENYLICDFRDPKVWEHEGKYYCILASRNQHRRGEILMFVSTDLIEWQFHSPILQTTYEAHTLLECPDYFQVDGKDVMLFSAMPCDPDYADQVKHRVCYAIGKLDYENGKFNVEHEGLLDYGNSFYAPQTTEGKEQERLLIGWMQSWNQASPPEGFTFNGMMSLPRQLSIVDGELVQYPVHTIISSFEHVAEEHHIFIEAGHSYDLTATSTGHLSLQLEAQSTSFTIHLQQHNDDSITCIVDTTTGAIHVYSDYSETTEHIIPIALDEALQLDLFFDLYSLELFVNGGQKVFTTTSYLTKGDGLSLTAQSNVTINAITLKQA